MKILNNKKGFSIVEVVIAMTVIAIVSATALTIVSTSSDNTRAAMYKADAQYLVYDALECFKTSTNEAEFISAFTFRGNVVDITSGESPVVPADEDPVEPEGEQQGSDLHVFLIVDSGYYVVVSMKFKESTGGDGEAIISRDIFSIFVTNSEGDTIASIPNYSRISKGA